MKLGFMHVSPAVENSPEAKIIKAWNKCIRRAVELSGDDVDVTFLVPRGGIRPDVGFYGYIETLMGREYLHGYMQLEKAGCDAVSVVCSYEQMLNEARQALDVPFIGPCDITLRMITMMSAKAGFIIPPGVPHSDLINRMRKYGLSEQEGIVMTLPISFDELLNAVIDSRVMIEAYIETSRKLIAQGAEVIAPICMGIDPVLAAAPGCEKEYPYGVKDVDGVPRVNVITLIVKAAQAFAGIKKAGLTWISRKGAYAIAKNNKKAMEMGASLLEYQGPGFWFD